MGWFKIETRLSVTQGVWNAPRILPDLPHLLWFLKRFDAFGQHGAISGTESVPQV